MELIKFTDASGSTLAAHNVPSYQGKRFESHCRALLELAHELNPFAVRIIAKGRVYSYRQTVAAPSYWAPYLINGDASGLSDADLHEAALFAAEYGRAIRCSHEQVRRFNGVLTETFIYTVEL